MNKNLFDIRINGERLYNSIMEMAEIGKTNLGGNCRVALSDEDKRGRDLFISWCKNAGCKITYDKIGNIFAKREGLKNVPPVAFGSHLDTQPHGGKFDGVYGVLSALEVIRTLNDNNIKTKKPVEIINWTNEEGARFPPAIIASATFAKKFTLEEAWACQDVNGITIGEEIKRHGYDDGEDVGNHKFDSFIEAHIEQGPILEDEGLTIGVVTGAQGTRWYDIKVLGQDSHAGSSPMNTRRDSLVIAASLITQINQLGMSYGEGGRSTVGVLSLKPASRNTVPGCTEFSVDLRHPNNEILLEMHHSLKKIIDQTNSSSNLKVELKQIFYSEGVTFNEKCVEIVQHSSDLLGYKSKEMFSGAGHDAVYISKVAPTSMIFVPCKDGLSHNELESAKSSDLEAGCNVLLQSILKLSVA